MACQLAAMVGERSWPGRSPVKASPEFEHQANAVVRVAGGGDDLTRDAERGQEIAALGRGQALGLVQPDLYVVVAGLHVGLHQRHARRLRLEHNQPHAARLQLLRQPGVVGVVMRGQ